MENDITYQYLFNGMLSRVNSILIGALPVGSQAQKHITKTLFDFSDKLIEYKFIKDRNQKGA